MQSRSRVIIIGAGFAGLYAAKTLAHKDVEVLLIDRNNFHTFTPLLYQVATCALDPSSIAYPVRSIFRNATNVHFMLGEVSGIDTDEQQVQVETQQGQRVETFDALLVATGSVTNFFGNVQLAQHAFELKTLNDAVQIREHILRLFERAAWSQDDAEKQALTTILVIGGGPTGLETAGALYELYTHVLEQEYNDQHQLKTRVILVEGTDHLLHPYPERLQQAAVKQLESLGVEVMLNTRVEEIHPDHVIMADRSIVQTHTVVWSAGVQGAPISQELSVELRANGQLPITPTLEVIGLEGVYAAGDLAYLQDKKGNPYPMLIPVAKQQGILFAKNLLRQLDGKPTQEFRYRDRGIMATIGRRRAVAWLYYRIQLTGFLAWLSWLFLHIVTLLGFRNRIAVFFSWVWNYLTYDRAVRLILGRGYSRRKL